MNNLLNEERHQFINKIETAKKQLEQLVPFYPYSILNNLTHLDILLADIQLTPEKILQSISINDIGGADGDISFYSEFLGCKTVNLIDHALTNNNQLLGAQKLKETLASNITIIDIDLDSTRGWEKVNDVETTIFLGILYHLQNPFLALSELSKKSKYLVLSTKIFDVINGHDISNTSCAYFYKPGECNNDSSNWWCFTDGCLKQMIYRADWEIIAYKRFGLQKGAEPVNMSKDGRSFAYLKSKTFR